MARLSPTCWTCTPGSNRIDTNNLRVLQEGADGKLWLGTEGDGLKRYDPANGQFERYADVFEPLLDPALRGRPMRVLGLAEGEADTLWVSGNQGLFHFDPAQRRARRVPIRLDADAPPNRDPSALRSMLRARDGSIWIGSYNVGLVHFYPQTETWRFYRHDPRGRGFAQPLAHQHHLRGSARSGSGSAPSPASICSIPPVVASAASATMPAMRSRSPATSCGWCSRAATRRSGSAPIAA
jgi:ligand-binding sensor domain-containing protein